MAVSTPCAELCAHSPAAHANVSRSGFKTDDFMIFRLKAEATEPDADSTRSIWKQLRSKPFRSHEKRGAGLRQGAES